jgi:hypothetical protein
VGGPVVTKSRPDIVWGRLLFGLILGAGMFALGVAGLRAQSVAAKWPGSENPAAVHAQLESTVVHDHATVEKRFVGKWVPQLRLVSETHPDLTASIAGAHDLADFLPLRKRYRALLLRGGDYNLGPRGSYVSIVPRAYRSSKQALTWCRKAHLGPTRCVAIRLTHRPAAKTASTR